MAVPKIRFKGFSGEWEKRKLGEVANVFDGTHQTPNYTDSGIMFLSVENIKTLQSEKFISKEDFDKEFKVFPEYGDILMTRIGDIGTANVVRSNNKIAYYVSLALMKPKKVDSDFLATAILSGSVQSEIWERTLHVAFPKKINKNEIDKLNIVIPDIDEQTVIGNFFRTLDDIIALYKRKLDGLKELKKGYLGQMFPRVGESVPRVRFTRFSGDWVERKLGDITEILMCKRIFNEQTSSVGDIPFYKIGTIGKEPDSYISKQLFEKYKEKYNYPRNGEVMVTCAGTVGRCWQFDGKDSYYQDSNIVWISNQSTILYNTFLLYIIANVDWGKLNSTTITRIYNDDLKKIKLQIPIIPEQTAIGNFFRNLDEQITAQQIKLDKLKQLKAAYLQRMFV